MDSLIIFSAKYLVYLVAAAAIVVLFLQKREIQKKIALFAVITLPIAYIVAKIAGKLYYDPRPFVSQHIKSLIPHAPTNGFPSDHALLSFAIAWVIFAFNKKLGVVFALFALLIGVSRVYVHVHSPIDIIGSFVISAIVAVAVYFGLQSFLYKKKEHVETE